MAKPSSLFVSGDIIQAILSALFLGHTGAVISQGFFSHTTDRYLVNLWNILIINFEYFEIILDTQTYLG